MNGFRPNVNWRHAHVGAGLTLVPLAAWAIGVLPPPPGSELRHAGDVPFAVNVGAYEPGTATANPNLGQPAEIYGGGAISFPAKSSGA